MIFRNRTPSEYIGYGLYFYFSGLSLRKAADRLSDCFIKRNHVSIWNWNWNWIQKIFSKKKKISEYVIDETVIKVGSDYIWIWVATIELESKEILGDKRIKRTKYVCCRTIYFGCCRRIWRTSGFH